ncbi:MAG TPA: hypothetical protein VMZ71_07455 [Gemmataceae bacterium]|nr:hypothetical protein [Gemmataceae bacterium]
MPSPHSLLAVLLLASPALAQQPRAPAGKCTSPAASFAARQTGGTAFDVLKENAELSTGDMLVTLPGATLESKNGAVSVKSLADYDSKSPLPILETALSLNPAGEADLDFTLDRGRVDITNKKAAGAAVVVVRFWDQTWRVSLDTPGTRVALELCGRWPSGTRFKIPEAKEAKPTAAPNASLILLVLSGEARADVGGVTLGLKAPPGPAMLEWDSVSGARPQPQKLDALPPWADPAAGLSDSGKATAAAVEKFRALRALDAANAIDTFLASADAVEQRIGLVTLGAYDDLDRLGQVLAAAKTLEQWDFGVTVVRHWLGRCPNQERKLFEALTAGKGMTPAQAKTVMQLLFGFAAEDLTQPETFEVLVEYLQHDTAAVRNLAAWHLHRLVPQGKSIPFSPTGDKAAIDKTYQAWKKLLPGGQVPKK